MAQAASRIERLYGFDMACQAGDGREDPMDLKPLGKSVRHKATLLERAKRGGS